jgi:glutamate-1-semialdehyde 2,1-aminomutase
MERLGQILEKGFAAIGNECGIPVTMVRQGSAFCIYFMDRAPVDWHDIAAQHDFAADLSMRRSLIERGIFFFPVATKQCSLSASHTEQMVEETLRALSQTIAQPVGVEGRR